MCKHPYTHSIFANREGVVTFLLQQTICMCVVLESGRDGRVEKEREVVKWRGTEGRFGLKRDIRDGMTCHHYICFSYCLLLLSWGCLASIHLSTAYSTHTCTHEHGLSLAICPHGGFIKCPYLYTEITAQIQPSSSLEQHFQVPGSHAAKQCSFRVKLHFSLKYIYKKMYPLPCKKIFFIKSWQMI